MMTEDIKVGDRVRLRLPAERGMEFIIPAGETGTVDRISEDGLAVRMDKHFDELDEWDNRVWWYPEMRQFLLVDLEVI
jgi:hypothetical protein